MLKDIFEKHLKNKNITDKLFSSLMDGYVDIKAYRETENGKQLVYHDTGDNVITDWMRQALMLMLVGKSVIVSNDNLNVGNEKTKPSGNTAEQNSTIGQNGNGYILNENQYLWNITDLKNIPETGYAIYPTKVLFGTGKEYASWDELKEDNDDNDSFLNNIISTYSDGEGTEDVAKNNFNSLIEDEKNFYSATVGTQGFYTYNELINSELVKTITVNDPNTSSGVQTSVDMHKQFGVVGAVKTLYLSENEAAMPQDILSDTLDENNNRLIKGSKRGAGYPCFIYFNREKSTNDWSQANAAEIFLTRDNNSKILNRITFKITMPAQTASNGNLGTYYPYNGYTLKQIGLFNDAFMLENNSRVMFEEEMPSGTMLAVKNIEAFTKTAEETIVLTWTLTI